MTQEETDPLVNVSFQLPAKRMKELEDMAHNWDYTVPELLRLLAEKALDRENRQESEELRLADQEFEEALEQLEKGVQPRTLEDVLQDLGISLTEEEPSP